MKIKGLFVCFLLCLILESFGQIPSNFPQNGLLAYYSFEGNTNDVSGNGNHLTNYGASLSNDKNGKSNSSYSFNGTSNYMQGPNTLGNIFYSNVQIGTNTIDGTTKLGALSISFWGKAATGNFISKYWNLDKNQSNFSVSNNRFTGDGTNYIDYQGTSSTDWKHYVIVITNGTNNSKIYINGVLSASGTLNLNTTATQAPFMVGRLYGSPEGYLNGSIDEIALFNRILSDQEAKAIYDLEVNKNPFNLPVSTISTNLSTISEVIGNSGSTVITASLATAPINDVKIDLETAGTATFDSDYTIDFTKKGKGVQVAGSSAAGAGLGDLSNPLGVTLDQVGNVYVADGYNHRIVKWEKDASIGTLVAGGNGQGSAANQFSVPNGVAVDKDGNIYVSDYANNRIQKWAKDATSGITILGGNGVGDSPNQIIKPVAICADSSGNIYVADSGNNRIQKWTVGSGNTATTVAGGNASGSALNQLAFPIGVKVDQSGNLYVAENGNHRVTKWAPGATQGVVVAGGNGGGLGLNQFNYPQGLGLDLQGNIYVSDYQSNSVKKWAPGATTGEIVAGATVSGNFVDAPFDMEADKFGNLFITDNRNQRILKLQFQPQFVIPAGQLTGNITVKGLPDQVNETDETIILTPLNKNYYYDGLSPINIKLNNINRIVSFSSDKSTIEEAGGSTVITATLNEAGLSDVTFGFTATGTATLNTDFKASSATVTIPAGQLSASFTITGINDLLNEDNETIVLTPLNVINASVGSGVSINMTSEDLPPSILFGLSSTTNNEAGAAITLTTRLSNKSAKTITATLSLAGTATKTSDYTLSAETLTFAPGDSIKTITITPVNDTDVEAVETLIVSIASSTNLSTIYPSSTISIASEDKPNVTLSLDKATISENAGTATLTATLSAATSYDVVMELSKTGTAVESSDFKFTRSGVVQIPASITIPAGQTTGTIDIIGQNDIYDEPDETVIINTSSISNANAPASSVTLTITSDDLPPSVALELSSNTLDEAGSAITLTGRLSKKAAKTITATISLTGTATKTSDYTLNSETFTFAPGDSIKTITISPVNDTSVEVNETIIVGVASSSNLSTTYPSAVTVNLSSDDNAGITLSFDKTSIAEKNGKATLTATLAAPSSKDVVINFDLKGDSNKDLDFNINFSSKGIKTVAGGNGVGNGLNQIANPWGIAMDKSGNIIVAENNSGRILKWKPGATQGEVVIGQNGQGSSNNQINRPHGLYVDTNDNIYISDYENRRVQKWLSGATQGSTVAGGNGIGPNLNQIYSPIGLYVDDLQNIYVTDQDNHRVLKWGPNQTSGTLIAGGNGAGTSPNQLYYPRDVFVDKSSNVYVIDGGGRLLKWTPGAKTGITLLSNLNWPTGLDVDKDGIFYISDSNNQRVVKWRVGQDSVVVIAGGNGSGFNENQLSSPAGVVLDSFGNLFVADFNNHRVQKIQNQPQIIIPAGQTTGTLEVVGLDDNLDEADETITLEAVSVENGTLPTAPVSLTITSDDLPPIATFELSAPSVDEDKTAVTLSARLSKKAGKTITANLAFSGTANKGVDYTLSAENFTIASGDSVATITITPTNDTAIEIIESITIGITSASGLDANFPTATLNILSEDKPNVAVSTSASTINEVKGQSTLTATLSAPTAKDVYVDLNLKGTATFDKDYQLNFAGKGLSSLLINKGQKIGNTTFTLPQKIAVDTSNNLWVGHQGVGSTIYDLEYKLMKLNPSDKSILKEINISVTDLQITSDGIVHVLSNQNILRYDLNGKLLESFAIPGWNNAPPRSFYYKNGFYYLAFNSDIYKLNYSTKSTVLFASITNSIHPMGIFRLVVKDNDELIFTDRNSVFKYKNNSVSSYINLSAFDPNYFNSENPYIELLPNGNVLVYRETPPSQTRNLSLEEFDSNGSKVKTWLSLAQSPIKNEFTGLGSFAIIPGKTDLYMSYYIDQSKLGSSYDVYNRNQIYQFPFKPSIKIPAGQTTGSLTFEGLEDLENEATETIDVKFASVQNANSPIGTAPTISITDNRITFTALNTAIPALTESALSWGDYDRDGDQDLAIMGYNDASGYQTAVWRNDNGTFNNTFQNLLRTSNGDIKWVDIDKDGYLDLMCSGVAIDASDVTSNKTVLYLNNKKGGLINAGTLNVEQLSGTKMAFGDLDNDGDLDLAILGYNSLDQAVFYLYEKDNNALAYNKITDFNAPMMSGTSLDWDLKIADFDLDGDNDIIYRGGSITNSYVQSNSLNFNINYTGLKYEVVKLFNRTGPLSVLAIGQQNGTNQFYSNEMIGFNGNAPALSEGDIAAGDFNNDGLNDFVVTGSDASNNPLTLLYYQRADNQFELMPNITLEGLYSSTADWVDYDVDGDLDLILTGRGASTQKTILYRNDTGTKVNKAPKAPSNLRVTDKGNGFVEFAWDTPSDDYSTYLGYNIRLGTSPGGTELSNTQSNLETGSRLITAPAPIYGNTYTTQLSPGKYYWSVQAIDQGFQGSPFATEKEVLLQYEWKTINQKNIINRTVSGGSSPKVLMVDYDNDKDLDLIIGSSSDRRVYQFDGRMFVPSTVSIGYGGVDNMIAEDINGDGKMDLVVNNTNGSNLTLSVYFNNGTGYNLAHTMSYPSLVNSRIKVLDLDSDGLQEVLIAGSTSLLSTASTKVYRLEYAGPQDPSINPTGVAFNEYTVNLTTGMTGVTTYDFGDINNDSKIDLIISGKTSNGLKTKIFLNNTVAGQTGDLTFTLTTDNLVATTAGTTDLVDYDGDGDLDILQTGTSGNGDVFQLYENTLQNNVANFSVINIGIDPIRNSKVRFGDFNGDGFFDLFFNGTRNTVSGQINQLVQLNPVSKLYETSTFNTGNLVNIEFAFADIESDGDLDLVITGDDATNANNKILNVYQNVRNQSAALNSLINQSVVEPKKSNNNMLNRLIDEQKMAHLGAGVSYNLNTRPAAPAIKSLTTATINNQKVLTFAWNKSIDDHTPATGLTYNLRIGTTATNDDILPSNATNDGVLKIPMEGNAEHNLSTSLKNLKDGVYYWSVQAIDAAFSGSTFSTPVKFEVINGSLKTSNPPIVTDGTSTTNSGIAQGIVIANLSASDPDGDPLTYAFVSGNESGIFSINASGQLILSTKPAVFQDPYILVISVSDGSNSRTLTYRVNFCESNFEATAQHLNITKTYKSKDSLKATSKVQGSSNITMEAPKSIELKPGFVAEKGTVFRANIGAGCQ